MATMVLGTLGGFLGPVGGIIGSLIGGIIDQQIFGAMQSPIEGPRLDELRLPTFDEGAPAPWVQGPTARVPCQIIWVSTMREVEVEEGGKGGGGGTKTIGHEYYVDIAIAFARQTLAPTKPLRKLWANGKLVYEAGIAVDRSSTGVSVTKSTENANFSTSCTNKSYKERLALQHEGGPFGIQHNYFKGIRSGAKLKVSGCTNGVNNGTWDVESVTLDADGVTGRSRVKLLRCQHSWKLVYTSLFTFT